MKILVACEKSNRVAGAFRAIGHDAWSCDIMPCEIDTPYHIQGDVSEHLKDGWDMMIAHPPCTYLSNAGLHYLTNNLERKEQLSNAYNFVLNLWNAPINRIAIENPTGWLNTHWMKPAQVIQPYYFGDNEMKTTCLWLKNLPILFVTKWLPKPEPVGMCVRKTGKKAGQIYNYYYHEGKNQEGRSRTFKGIAEAMAIQWGSLNN